MSSTVPNIAARSPLAGARTVRLSLMALFLTTVGVWFFSKTLLAANFLPHWFCYLGNQRLLWTNVIGDLLIGLSYVAISGTLAWIVRHAGRNLPYSGFFWAFGLFIVSCGATHFMEVLTVWKPVYWLAAAVKLVTTAASAGTAVVLFVAAGDIVGFVRTAREAATRLGNERYRALVDSAPMAVVSATPDLNVTAWNPAAERTFGWTAAEAIGNKVFFVPPDKEEEHKHLARKTFAGEVTTGFETVRIDRAGNRFPVSISAAPIYDENGGLAGTLAVFEDISERKRIEQELQEKTLVLTTVTQGLNTFLDTGDWSAASKHLLSFAIRQTQSLYGFLGVVLDGQVLRILAHDGVTWDAKFNRELYETKMRDHAANGYFEIMHVHNLLGEVILKGQTVVANSPQNDQRSGGLPQGHPQMDSFLGVPIFKGKETVGLIGVANRPGGYTGEELGCLETMSKATGVLYDSYRQDLKRAALQEDQKRLETQMRQSQKMEVLGRLAGGVAHDFNNMLMILGGSAELLERALPAESPARMYLDQIQRTTEKAAAITKQLLAFSRKQVLEFRRIDLHEALTECEFMLPRLLGSDVVLTFNHQATRSWILSDPSQIEQVVANLAINSRDAMPQGGTLSISTRNASHLPNESALEESAAQAWVVLEVADSGCGIDEKTRAQIFEPFFTTKPEGKGTGLGLSTVYGIVKQSNGHIHVESTPGLGTRFQIFFSVIEPPPAAPPSIPPLELSEDSGQGVTILVADDQTALRHAVVEILRTSGYTVIDSESSSEALELARAHKGTIDILLTDVVMPGLRGPELARRVTQIHRETQVVYMSGYAEGFSEAELPANGVFLQKPFRFATLLEQLKLMRRKV
jgi:two-component system, cell cycle sensor histidine kinase and response regulator CckA